jgi:hypothetical protein
MKPPAPQDPAEVVASAVQVDLASFQAAAQGAPLAAGVAMSAGGLETLADEWASFMAFVSENYAKLVEEQLAALAFYKEFKSRIPKIAVLEYMGMLGLLTTSTSTNAYTVNTLRLCPVHTLCSMYCRARTIAIFALHSTSGVG